MPTNRFRQVDVVVLCGGLGKRLRPVVSDQPKVLARIGNKTFLDILIHNLLVHGFRSIILSVGYLKEQIESHFYCNRDGERDYTISFSEEEEPLGTGGALKNAKPLIRSDPFMVVNGDSICEIGLKDFVAFHRQKGGLLSLVVARSKTAQEYGSIILGDSQRVISFNEKVSDGSGLVNAGIYLMQKDIFSYMPDQDRFSLEYDLFPEIINNRCYGFLTKGELIDIGTPERYEKAKSMIKTAFLARNWLRGLDSVLVPFRGPDLGHL